MGTHIQVTKMDKNKDTIKTKYILKQQMDIKI